MKILVTGSAGFIGSAVCKKLLIQKYEVIGIDNLNNYYDPKLKISRLKNILDYKKFKNYKIDISDKKKIFKIFKKYNPKIVVHLAAQAGVRYSLLNPTAYIDSNLKGFGNILEGCRNCKVKHLVYASSSSVYGANTNTPYSVKDNVDHPVSFYAATKKANELMAHSYSHLYNLPSTGLRFFTVYGPWDRPDMALQKFTKAILNNKTIKVYNKGNHERDFTFIDDIVDGLIKVLKKPAKPDLNWSSKNPNPNTSSAPWKLYNIGNSKPVKLMDFVSILEKNLNKKAKIKFISKQPGDVIKTWADIDGLVKEFNYKPDTTIHKGISKFCKWYLDYYKS